MVCCRAWLRAGHGISVALTAAPVCPRERACASAGADGRQPRIPVVATDGQKTAAFTAAAALPAHRGQGRAALAGSPGAADGTGSRVTGLGRRVLNGTLTACGMLVTEVLADRPAAGAGRTPRSRRPAVARAAVLLCSRPLTGSATRRRTLARRTPARRARDGLARDGLARDGLARDGLARAVSHLPRPTRATRGRTGVRRPTARPGSRAPTVPPGRTRTTRRPAMAGRTTTPPTAWTAGPRWGYPD